MADNIIYVNQRDFNSDYRVLIEIHKPGAAHHSNEHFHCRNSRRSVRAELPGSADSAYHSSGWSRHYDAAHADCIPDNLPIEKRGQAMGMVGLVISFAPAIGPTLSGWAVEAFSWRSLFYIILPFAVIDLILASILMKNVTTLRKTQIDILSVILSTFGFGGLLYGFSSVGSYGWSSSTVLISLLVGVIALLLFITRQMKLKNRCWNSASSRLAFSA